MKKILIAMPILAMSVVSAMSADDPVAVRKALMDANGAATGAAVGMMKGEIPYNPAVAQSVIMTQRGVAKAFGDYFPEDSAMAPNTTAAPAIWDDPDGFAKHLAEFQEATQAAAEASGKEGPADVEAFKAAIGPVLQTCKGCHENYRVKQQ